MKKFALGLVCVKSPLATANASNLGVLAVTLGEKSSYGWNVQEDRNMYNIRITIASFDKIYFRTTRDMLGLLIYFFWGIFTLGIPSTRKALSTARLKSSKKRNFPKHYISLRYNSLQTMCNSPNRVFLKVWKELLSIQLTPAFPTPADSSWDTSAWSKSYKINNFHFGICVFMHTKFVKNFLFSPTREHGLETAHCLTLLFPWKDIKCSTSMDQVHVQVTRYFSQRPI